MLNEALRKCIPERSVSGPNLRPRAVAAWNKVASEEPSYGKTNWQINALQFFLLPGPKVTLKMLKDEGLEGLTRHIFEEAQSLVESGKGRAPLPAARGGRPQVSSANIRKDFEVQKLTDNIASKLTQYRENATKAPVLSKKYRENVDM